TLKKKIEQLIEERRVDQLFKQRLVATGATEKKGSDESDPGAIADTGLLRVIKPNSCNGGPNWAGACEGSSGDIGPDSCNGDWATCSLSSGTIGPRSCNEFNSCPWVSGLFPSRPGTSGRIVVEDMVHAMGSQRKLGRIAATATFPAILPTSTSVLGAATGYGRAPTLLTVGHVAKKISI
ncbi:hypothetical protein ACHAXT_006006, partial [Thalassiosira profunda]